MTQMILLVFALFSAIIMALSLYWNNLPTKFVSIFLLVVLANCVYFSLDGVKGWPAEEPREIKGVLASVIIVNPSDSDPGAIYISVFPKMITKWYQYSYPRNAPKTFYVEYSNDRAAQFEKANDAIKQGKEVRINGIPPKTTGKSDNNGEGTEENFSGIISKLLNKILPKQGDTYRPNVPDVEIIEQEIPEKKGSNQ